MYKASIRIFNQVNINFSMTRWQSNHKSKFFSVSVCHCTIAPSSVQKCNFCLFPTESLDIVAPDVKFPDRWRQRRQRRYKNKKFCMVHGIKIIPSYLNYTRSCGYFGMPYPIL